MRRSIFDSVRVRRGRRRRRRPRAPAGCGLISSDVTDFDLTLPDKTFTVDTASWQLNGVDTFTSTDCSSQMGVCAAAAQQACKQGQCFGSCDADTQTCDLQVLVSLWQMVDLLSEKPELQTINDQPLVGVTIDSVDYEVTENTLNVDTPEMKMYVAPGDGDGARRSPGACRSRRSRRSRPGRPRA